MTSMCQQVYTHRSATAARPSSAGDNLVASHGRLCAVVANGTTIDFLDLKTVDLLQEVLGSGACRFKLLGTLAVVDRGDHVQLESVCFLPGGQLVVTGQAGGSAVIHAYALHLSAAAEAKTAGGVSLGETVTFATAAGAAAAPDITLSVLPRLVYRAALPGVARARVLRLPTRPHAFGVLLAGDDSVRFYDITPAPLADSSSNVSGSADATSAPAAGATASVGRIHHGAPVTLAATSEDGRLVAVADTCHQVGVYACSGTGMGSGSGGARAAAHNAATQASLQQLPAAVAHVFASFVPAATSTAVPTLGVAATTGSVDGWTRVATIVCEAPVTALSLMPVPCAPEAHVFEPTRFSDWCVLTGHETGFFNVWWLGARAQAVDAVVDARTGQATADPTHHDALDAAPGLTVAPAYQLLTPTGNHLLTKPLASYPPLHASLGPVTHISQGVIVDEADDSGGNAAGVTAGPLGRWSVPSMFGSDRAGATTRAAARHPTTSTVVAVGAEGARGWRVYSFDHTMALPSIAAATPAAAVSDLLAAVPTVSTAVVRHTAPAASTTAASAAAFRGTALGHPTLLCVPDEALIPGRYEWDAKRGRRMYVPPPPRVVDHLVAAGIRCPDLSECIRAPIIGGPEAGAAFTGAFSRTLAEGAAGVLGPAAAVAGGSAAGALAASHDVSAGSTPLGWAVIARGGCRHEAHMHSYVRGNRVCGQLTGAGGGLTDGVQSLRHGYGHDLDPAEFHGGDMSGSSGWLSDAALVRRVGSGPTVGLPPCSLVADHGVWRLLSRNGSGLTTFRHPAAFPLTPTAAAVSFTGGAAALAREMGTAGRHLHAPRIAMLLLTDRGLHAAGADYHSALIADISPAIRAATGIVMGAAKRTADAAVAAGAAAAMVAPPVVVATKLPPAAAAAVPPSAPATDTASLVQHLPRIDAATVAAAPLLDDASVTEVPDDAAAPATSHAADALPGQPPPQPPAAPAPARDICVDADSGAVAVGIAGAPVGHADNDEAYTARARRYWPSAAVTSRVHAVRRTIFTPPDEAGVADLQPVSQRRAQQQNHRHERSPRLQRPATAPAQRSSGSTHAATSPDAHARSPPVRPARPVTARSPAAPVVAVPAAPAPVMPPRVPAGLQYMPRYTRARLLAKLEPGNGGTPAVVIERHTPGGVVAVTVTGGSDCSSPTAAAPVDNGSAGPLASSGQLVGTLQSVSGGDAGGDELLLAASTASDSVHGPGLDRVQRFGGVPLLSASTTFELGDDEDDGVMAASGGDDGAGGAAAAAVGDADEEGAASGAGAAPTAPLFVDKQSAAAPPPPGVQDLCAEVAALRRQLAELQAALAAQQHHQQQLVGGHGGAAAVAE